MAGLPPGAAYRWLTASVVPRPVAWVSTTSADGVDNLAPHSFFTVASADPPVVCFTSVGTKDTLRNVRATGELVVCLAPRGLSDAVNATATDYPPGTSEFDAVGLAREPSARVRPPRVAGSPLALECRSAGERSFGRSTVVFAEVVHVAVAPGVLAADGLPDPRRLDPASRLGRHEWGALGEVYDLRRVPYADLR
ncbi:flavin reductase family protein [Vallicoccus soli]|uniref:Flavin reductase family protein n=1 Tax=Vallicoccus soli TaxID=2339232 RepID=A0A3A3Z728_9ACTN|nr:flavin reductase family protein [Vallicoccus soli]